MKRLFDTHTHLLDRRLADSMDEHLEGVEKAVCVYSPDEDIDKFSELLLNHKVLGSAGIHPHDASRAEKMWPSVHRALDMDGVVAVGETGLDFHYTNSPPEAQKKVFAKHLDIARRRGLPVIIHSRDAFSQTLQVLDENPPPAAVVHCFTGSEKEMNEYLKRGFYIGIGGVVTFSKSAGLKEAVKKLPPENIFLETDCPYLAPEPKRGKTNSPSYLKYIAGEVASLKKMAPREIAGQSYKNAQKFFSTEM